MHAIAIHGVRQNMQNRGYGTHAEGEGVVAREVVDGVFRAVCIRSSVGKFLLGARGGSGVRRGRPGDIGRAAHYI